MHGCANETVNIIFYVVSISNLPTEIEYFSFFFNIYDTIRHIFVTHSIKSDYMLVARQNYPEKSYQSINTYAIPILTYSFGIVK